MKLNTEPIFDISLQVCQPVHQHIYVWSWCFVHGHSQAVARSFARSFPASDVTFVPARRACSIVLTGLNRTALHLVALFIARSLTVVFPLLTSSSLILTAYCDLVSLFARRACPIVWTGFKMWFIPSQLTSSGRDAAPPGALISTASPLSKHSVTCRRNSK